MFSESTAEMRIIGKSNCCGNLFERQISGENHFLSPGETQVQKKCIGAMAEMFLEKSRKM